MSHLEAKTFSFICIDVTNGIPDTLFSLPQLPAARIHVPSHFVQIVNDWLALAPKILRGFDSISFSRSPGLKPSP